MYNERKSIEAAAFLLRKADSQSMGYYELVKLMYLADREQIRSRGRSISGDTYWSLPWAPVLGHVFDAVRQPANPEWNRHFETDLDAKAVRMHADAPPGRALFRRH